MTLDDYFEHERIVDTLFKRLHKSGRYHSIQKHVNYGNKKVCGEADIITMSENNIHYYEVKIHANDSSRYKAHKQFSRFEACHPVVHTKYIYVTPTEIKRFYITPKQL